MSLLDQFSKYLSESKMVSSGNHLLVAVSGGMDSMSLLHLFHSLQDDWRFRLTVAHVNHHLHSQSTVAQRFVETVCKKWGLDFRFSSLDPAQRGRSVSEEAWARENRYAALEQMRQDVKADWIVTAHHQNDQIETILLRLSTGSGISGLQGIRLRLGRVVRPLLTFTRRQIETYAVGNGLSYIDDPTNLTENIPRNFIRHRIVREWEKHQPGLLSNFQTITGQAQEVEEIISYVLDVVRQEIVASSDNDEYRIEQSRLERLPILIRLRLLKQLIGEDTILWRRHQYERLKVFLRKARTGQMLTLQDNWDLLRDRSLWILKKAISLNERIYHIQPGTKFDCDAFTFQWKWVKKGVISNGGLWRETVDGGHYEKEILTIRTLKPGDKFQPLGMSGVKKVSDFLTDLKVNRFKKQQQWVLTAKGEILWVCGHRISERVKVTADTKCYAELSMTLKVG